MASRLFVIARIINLDNVQITIFRYASWFVVPKNGYICIVKQLKTFQTMAYVISDDCIACGTCIDECPVGAISEGDKYSINPDMCTECGTCADVCPSEAIHLG